MGKKLLFLVWFATFAIFVSASKIPVYLSMCPSDKNSDGNAVKRTPVQPLCIWQEQNSIYVPQGENIYCMLSDADGIVCECIVSASGVVVFPSDLHGQYELLIQLNGASYKGEINL